MRQPSRTREEREWLTLPPGACAAGGVVREDDPDDVLAIVVVETGTGRSTIRICRLLPQDDLRAGMAELGMVGEPVIFCTAKCTYDALGAEIPSERVIEEARSLEKKMRSLAKLCVSEGAQPVPPAPVQTQPSTSDPGLPSLPKRMPGPTRQDAVDQKLLKRVMKAASRERNPADRADAAQEIIEKVYKQGYAAGENLTNADPGGVVRAIAKGLVSRKIRKRTKDTHISLGQATALREGERSSGRHHASHDAMYRAAREDAKRRIEGFIGREISRDDLATLDHIDRCWSDAERYDEACQLLTRALSAMLDAYDYVAEGKDLFGGVLREDLRRLVISPVDFWRSYLLDVDFLSEVPLSEYPPDMDDIYGVREGLRLALKHLGEQRAARPRTRLGFIIQVLDRYDVFCIGRPLRAIEVAAVAVFRGVELNANAPANPKKLLTCMPFDEIKRYVDKARSRRPPAANLFPRQELSAPTYMTPDLANPRHWFWYTVGSTPSARAVAIPDWLKQKKSDRK